MNCKQLSGLIPCLILASIGYSTAQEGDTTLATLEVRAKASLETVLDTISKPYARSLSDRLAGLPGVTQDLQGRVKWRGTDELSLDFDEIPLSRDQVTAFPSNLWADISTDPQPDASQISQGMGGIIHILPQEKDKNALDVEAGGADPIKEWAGVQGSYVQGPFRIWTQVRQQAMVQQNRELWKDSTISVKNSWTDSTNRAFGLVGLAYGQFEIEAWMDTAYMSTPYSRSAFVSSSDQVNQLWDPIGGQGMKAVTARWALKGSNWALSAMADGMISRDQQSADPSNGDAPWSKDWSQQFTQGKAQGEIFDADLWKIRLGAQQSWDGWDYHDGSGVIWQTQMDALWTDGQIKVDQGNAKIGLRLENTQRSYEAYDRENWYLLPSFSIQDKLPWFNMEGYARYDRRLEMPEQELLAPGSRMISPWEGRIGNSDLKPEQVHTGEVGLSLPIPEWHSKFDIKYFSVFTYDMLMRDWTMIGDSAYLHEQNGLWEDRNGVEGHWSFTSALCELNLQGALWIEDREINESLAPKQEIFGGNVRLQVAKQWNPQWKTQLSFGWNGPSFDPEGQEDPYFEESLALTWTPTPSFSWILGGDGFFGDDRSLQVTNGNSATNSDGTSNYWTRIRYSDGPRVWTTLNYSIF